MNDVLVGLDVGTTATKILVQSTTSPVPLSQRRVPLGWFGDGRPSARLSESWRTLLAAMDGAVAEVDGRAVGIGIASVGESGVLVAADGEDLTSPLAWHDPAGEDELREAVQEVGSAQFAAVTGLPVTSLCSAAKIAYFRRNGVRVRGATWLTLGEYLAFRLTGVRSAEFSLASRTGLLRQDGRSAYTEVVRALGADDRLLPSLTGAGVSTGRATGSALPDTLRGAAVTVAGHDHLVAAFASGIVAPGDVFNSAGTGDVILSIAPHVPDETRLRLVDNGATSGTFLDGVSTAVVAGIRGGLVLQSVLSMIGADDLDARNRLDRSAVASDRMLDVGEDARVSVVGANKDASRVVVTLHADDVTTDELWWAAIRETVREATRLWRLTQQLGPVTTVRCAGGWTRLASIRRAKRAVFGEIEFLPDLEAGALGAAVLAGAAAYGSGYAGARLRLEALRPASRSPS